MTIYVVQNGNMKVEFLNLADAQSYANSNGLSSPTSYEKSIESNTYDVVLQNVKSRQNEGLKILAELYALNIVNGITLSQSDQMFEDFNDVLTRVREGAFETAVYRLESKQPSGFVTQSMIDGWISLIESYL